MTAIADVLGKIWTLPNTIAGLLIGFFALAFGARAEISNNAIVFSRVRFLHRAFTLGNVIFNPRETFSGHCPTYHSVAQYRRCGDAAVLEYVELARHKEAHTYQYQVLGPLFLPVYALTQILPSPTPFERAADIYAKTGTGWWPTGLTNRHRP